MKFPRPDWGFVSDFFQHKCVLCRTDVGVRSYRLDANIGGKAVHVSAYICQTCFESYSNMDVLAKVVLGKRGAI